MSDMGSRYERQLVRTLGDEALPAAGPGRRRAAMRCPSSGSATARDLPDVLAGTAAATHRSAAWAIEVKCTKATTAYAKGKEIAALQRFADIFGARPVLAARFKRSGGQRQPFYLVDPNQCRMTDSGNYGVPESDAAERAFALVYPPTTNKPPHIDMRGPEETA